ncbi:MAG: hypothetical protein NXI22_10080 [bacterium]|nr:hypothetical protein [bacterium]
MSTESESQLEEFVERFELVTDVYGEWPKFDGAFVCAVTLESHSTLFYELGERTLTLDLHWWTAAPDHYPGGPIHYDLSELHRRIKIAFQVDDIHVHTFHSSDTSIDSLDIVVSGSRGTLKCAGGFDLRCDVFDARVLSVVPCDASGEAIAETPDAEQCDEPKSR